MLEGKHILVAGASGAIGRAVARACLAEGATVLLGYHRHRDPVAAILGESGGRARALELDFSSVESLRAGAAGHCREFSDLAGFVNCTGVHVAEPFISLGAEEIAAQIDVNLTGAIFLTQIVCRQMVRNRGGSIIHLGSVSAHRMIRGHCVYSATKAGLEGFVKALAAEVARRGVRVNCVLPGPVMSDMLQKTMDLTGAKPQEWVPLRRLINAEEVAHLVVFLLSDKAAAITGSVMSVDGGYLLL